MIRVLSLIPTPPDVDVAGHLAAIRTIAEVSLSVREVSDDGHLALIFRDAARLVHGRREIDVVLSVGAIALSSVSISWRGPHVHIPVGKLTRLERALIGRAGKHRHFRLVTSSPSLAQDASRYAADARQIRVIRPQPLSAALGRAAARKWLGVGTDASLIYLPGFARPGSNHRLALWASSILVFRDPSTRVLYRAGGCGDAFVSRFASSTRQRAAMTYDRGLNEADLASAADVAICAADSAPDFMPLAALHDAGTPIVSLQSTWSREGLSNFAATLVDAPKARLLARAALEAMESPRGVARIEARIGASAGAEWRDLLRSVDGSVDE